MLLFQSKHTHTHTQNTQYVNRNSITSHPSEIGKWNSFRFG